MTAIVPIFVCVVLPIAIVMIIALTVINRDNKRSQVLIKAIESNKGVDTDKLVESLEKQPRKSSREILNQRLLRGCIYTFTGVVLGVTAVCNFCAGLVFSADGAMLIMILGGVSLAIGVSYLIVYFVTRKQVKE